ncbi:hypothetical protein VTI74DRAFT_4453 [Chaetomium olivicolor]
MPAEVQYINPCLKDFQESPTAYERIYDVEIVVKQHGDKRSTTYTIGDHDYLVLRLSFFLKFGVTDQHVTFRGLHGIADDLCRVKRLVIYNDSGLPEEWCGMPTDRAVLNSLEDTIPIVSDVTEDTPRREYKSRSQEAGIDQALKAYSKRGPIPPKDPRGAIITKKPDPALVLQQFLLPWNTEGKLTTLGPDHDMMLWCFNEPRTEPGFS